MNFKLRDRVKIKQRSKSKYKGRFGTIRKIHGEYVTMSTQVTIDIDDGDNPLITTIRNCELIESYQEPWNDSLTESELESVLYGRVDIDFSIDVICSSAPDWLRQTEIEERGAEEMNSHGVMSFGSRSADSSRTTEIPRTEVGTTEITGRDIAESRDRCSHRKAFGRTTDIAKDRHPL